MLVSCVVFDRHCSLQFLSVCPFPLGELEDAKGRCTNPLYRRLDNFLHEGKTKIANIKTQLSTTETSISDIMCKYGENLKALSDVDTSQKFFTTMATFAKSFRSGMLAA